MPHRPRFRKPQLFGSASFSREKRSKAWQILLRRGLISVVLLVLLGVVSAALPHRSTLPTQTNCESTIYVASDNFHTTLILPITDLKTSWQGILPTHQSAGKSSYHYLGFGWGEQLYYTRPPENPILKLLAGLKAILWLNDSVMSVTEYAQLPMSSATIEVKAISMSRENYRRLVEFIRTSFQFDRAGRAIPIPDAANYYRAMGKYSLLRTCNTWTAEGLDRAGVETPLWSGLASSVMRHLRSTCGG